MLRCNCRETLCFAISLRLASPSDYPFESRRPRFRQEYFKPLPGVKTPFLAIGALFKTSHLFTIRSARNLWAVGQGALGRRTLEA